MPEYATGDLTLVSRGNAQHFYSSLLFFPWLFPSYRVTGMTDDLPSPYRHVHLLTFQVSLARVFSSCFPCFCLPFPRNIHSQHFPQYVFFISPHHMPLPVESSLRDLFRSLRHSRCPSCVCSFLILFLRVTLHIHRSILHFFSTM